MKEELRPCPFCGGKARVEKMGFPHHVYCKECGARVTGEGYEEEGEQSAIRKWNRRSDKYAWYDRVGSVKREKIENVASDAKEIYNKEMKEYLKNGNFDGRFFTLDFLMKLNIALEQKEKCRITLEYDPAENCIQICRFTYSE